MNENLLDNLFDGLFVVIGAAIATASTWWTTSHFNKEAEYEKKKSLVISVFMKLFEASNDVTSLQRDLNERLIAFEKAYGRKPSPDEYWNAISPIIGLSTDDVKLTSDEMALFANDAEVLQKFIEFLSFRRVTMSAVHAYSDARRQTGRLLSAFSRYEKNETGFRGSAMVNVQERPDIHAQVLETQDLCLRLMELVGLSSDQAGSIAKLANKKLPSLLRKGDFKMSFDANAATPATSKSNEAEAPTTSS